MKKLRFAVAVLGLALLSASCHGGYGTRVIAVHDNDFSLRIEYSGKITFTDDTTAIKNISREGYVKYEINGKTLEAEKHNNKIVYRLYGEIETSNLMDDDKKFVSDAVHEMVRRGHYKN